jgi:hypothetical protein
MLVLAGFHTRVGLLVLMSSRPQPDLPLCPLRRPCVRVGAKKTALTRRCRRSIPHSREASWATAENWTRSAHPSLLASHICPLESLQTCPNGSDAVTKHILALSTYLGHSKVAHKYWYLEAVPELMRDIADRTEESAMGRRT